MKFNENSSINKVLELEATILSRLHNCKFTSAYTYALQHPMLPKETITALKKASGEFGNCGVGGDLIYNTSMDLVDLI